MTAIEAVTGASLSLGAYIASDSMAEPLSPQRQTEREKPTDSVRKIKREKDDSHL